MKKDIDTEKDVKIVITFLTQIKQIQCSAAKFVQKSILIKNTQTN